MATDDLTPFRVDVPEAVLDDLRDRLARTRWPDHIPNSGWGYGTDLAYLQDLCEYWGTKYDWRAQEDRFNRWPHFLTTIDGQQIHFIHARSDNPDALPLVITHGWPGSVAEFLDIIEPLRADFHVVAPSLPGYGWSGPTTAPGWDVARVAEAWKVLMARLGYTRYGAQGGDWGAFVSARLAAIDPEHVVGLHSNLLLAFPSDPSTVQLTDSEAADLAAAGEFMTKGSAYQEIQGKNPQTLGYGLTDSPAGLAGWIMEKFMVWTDNDGNPEDAIPRDALLTNLTVYWVTKTINSSIRLYCESQRGHNFGPSDEYVSVPTAAAVFPKEIFRCPRAYAESRFNIVRYTRFDRGGHFAALEEPDLLVQDVREFFLSLHGQKVSGMHDLVIKGGRVVDGTGAPARSADVAITDGVVTEVGAVDGGARHTVNADGAVVTPGFVDVHTHFDGQVTWDPMLTPSCWHGVTTIVMGNCGVGFAPAKPEKHDWLIGLMEGVEDIPGAALSEGIVWTWEHFPEYLDAVERAPKMLDVGAQVPHGAVRAYVMGERGAKNEPATADDIDAMARIVKEGIEAGALGFSTSRTIAHMAIDGEPVPGTFAAEDELFGIGRVLGELGRGVFELAPAGALGEDLAAPEREMAWMRKLSAAIKRPVSFALTQNDHDPESWRLMLAMCAESAAKEGAQVRPQVAGRPVSLLLGLQTFHPFAYCPSWAPIGGASLAEKLAAMNTPALREKLLAEVDAAIAPMQQFLDPERAFPMGAIPDYEPKRSASIAALARAQGVSPMEYYYDALIADDGLALVLRPLLNFTDFNLDCVREMLLHPSSAWGLGDGGAHCGTTCDASTPTFMLAHWTRDRDHNRLPLEWVVKKMTSDTASMYGLGDRGVLAPGMVGDVNVIDYDNLQLERPVMVHDLPANGRRFVQRAHGYLATVKSGEVVTVNAEDQGARPGRLLRGAR